MSEIEKIEPEEFTWNELKLKLATNKLLINIHQEQFKKDMFYVVI
jgi:hypothetical protein